MYKYCLLNLLVNPWLLLPKAIPHSCSVYSKNYLEGNTTLSLSANKVLIVWCRFFCANIKYKNAKLWWFYRITPQNFNSLPCQAYSHFKRKVHVAEGYVCIINEASAHDEVCIWQHHQCFQEDLHCDCSLMICRVELIPNKNLIISVT